MAQPLDMRTNGRRKAVALPLDLTVHPLYSAIAILALLMGMTLLLQSCSNPNAAPSTSTVTAADYSPTAFFNTQSFGDTSTVPFPFCFPTGYLQQALGLTDTQVVAIQNLQDSLRLGLQGKLDSMKLAGTINLDSVRALRLEYQTDLYTGIAAILTPAQLTALQNLAPPIGPRSGFGRGPMPPGRRRYGRDHDADDSARAQFTAAQRDSLQLVRIEAVTAASGDTLTANQFALIQNLQATIDADTTLTPDGRRAEFDAQLQTILTAKQWRDLRYNDFADNRWHHR